MTMLQQMYSNPNYSSGQQKLDNLLLQGQPGQLGVLDQAGQYGTDLQNAYSGAQTGTADLANLWKQHATDVQQGTRDALGGAISTFGTDANKAAIDAATGRSASYNSALNNLGAGQMSEADLARFGIDPNLNIYNNDLTKYITKSAVNPTARQAITPDQQRRIDSLEKLAGGSVRGDPSKVIEAFRGNTEAGSFKDSPYSFNKDALLADAAKSKVDFNKDFENFLKSGSSKRDGLQWDGQSYNADPAERLQKYLSNVASFSPTSYNDGSAVRGTLSQYQKLLSKFGLDPNTGKSRTIKKV